LGMLDATRRAWGVGEARMSAYAMLTALSVVATAVGAVVLRAVLGL
jgi:hypothetical protein